MAALFSPEYQWLWTVVLAVALFFPVWRLIWVISVRRAQRKTGDLPDDETNALLRNRAAATAVLLCVVFSVVYVNSLFVSAP